MYKRILTATALLLLLVMSGHVPPAETQETRPAPPQAATRPERPCRDFTDRKGRRWRSRKYAQFAEDPKPGEKARWERPKRQNVLKSPGRMTVAELARAMRPVALANGCEYDSEPSSRPARWARQNVNRVFDSRGSRGSYGGAEVDEGVPASTPTPKPNVQSIVIGGDQREKRRDNTSYPMRTQVLLSNLNNGGRCSGTMIGPSTMITAAHCVHDSSNWLATKTWSPGVDSQDTVVFPFNPFGATYPTNNAANTAVFQCYWVTIPGGWADGGDDEWDFAVIEFANGYDNCNLSPGNTVG